MKEKCTEPKSTRDVTNPRTVRSGEPCHADDCGGQHLQKETSTQTEAATGRVAASTGTGNGMNGYVVRGRGNYASASIFLPCTGFGHEASLGHAGSTGAYWASVPHSDYSNSEAWDLGFNSGSHAVSYYYRYFGQPVRPVQGFTE